MSTPNVPFLWLDGRKLSIFHFVWFVNKTMERGLPNFRQAFSLLVFLLILRVKTKGMVKTGTSILLGVLTTDGKNVPVPALLQGWRTSSTYGSRGQSLTEQAPSMYALCLRPLKLQCLWRSARKGDPWLPLLLPAPLQLLGLCLGLAK